jgi:hypothetical protein
MIIMSFIFARKHFRIDYNMKQYLPYGIMAVGMVIFSRIYEYESI